jgi:LPS-assembly protein
MAAPPATCPLPPFENTPPPRPSNDKTITIDADAITAFRFGRSLFEGDVEIVQGDQRLRSNRAVYDSKTREVDASGNVLFATPDITALGERGQYSLDTHLGKFFDATYRLPRRHGRGTAKEIHLTGPGLSELHEVTYTTCPIGHDDWVLNTPTVELDRNSDVGIAYNATIDFFGVPIFYTPFISFPLSGKRKSGFLAPTLGYSGGNGLDITLPYYFNIAPNMDATLAPRLLGHRGVLINTQYRYLLPGTTGELDYDVLPYDRLTGERRDYFSFGNHTEMTEHWNFDASLNHVSDGEYFQDFGNSLAETSTVQLRSDIGTSYNDMNWSFGTDLISYQTFGVRTPYRELPDITLAWQAPVTDYRLDYGFNSELVRFQYPGLINGKPQINGDRLHIQPGIDYTLGTSGYYLQPAAKLDLTEYSLFNVSDPMQPTRIGRAAPILSLDGGLVFERNADSAGNLIETLEPRLFYLYVPYHDQRDIPIFDTHGADFNFVQLFSDNRFIGTDRLGDANQVSYALTTRFIRPNTGKELLAASIGQIHYFEDRRVTLPGQSIDTRPTSDLVGELRFNINDRWSSQMDWQWNPTTRQNDVGEFQLSYQPAARQVVNLGYRYRRGQLEETDVSLAWPVTRNWRFVGRWNYSLSDQATHETFAGLEYENCCWAMLFVDRHYLAPDGKLRSALYFELQLKGLGRLGRQIEDFLQRGILGYETD